MSQEEVRAEFVEDIERVQVQTEHLGDSERKRKISLFFAWELSVLLRIVV